MAVKRWCIVGVLIGGLIALNYRFGGYFTNMVFYMVIAFLLVSFLHLLITYMMFRANHELQERIVSKNYPVAYLFRMENPMPIITCPLALKYHKNDAMMKDKKEFNVLMPGQMVEIEAEFTFSYRGDYVVGVSEICFKDFTGLFQWTFRGLEEKHILVYPQLKHMEVRNLEREIEKQESRGMSKGQGIESTYSEVRPFVAGDPLKHMHWILSAKKGEWMVKSFEKQEDYRIQCIMDTDSFALERPLNLLYEDHMVEALLAMIHYFLEKNIETYLFFKSREIEEIGAQNLDGFESFYKILSPLRFRKGSYIATILEKVLEKDLMSQVIIISQRVDEDLVGKLLRQKKRLEPLTLVIPRFEEKELLAMQKYVNEGQLMTLKKANVVIYFMTFDKEAIRLEAV